MSDQSITSWVRMEQDSFRNFDEYVASLTEEAFTKSIPEKLRHDVEKKGKAELVLPWGTYFAEAKTVGETGNITPTWEPSKGFMKMLNDDTDSVNMDRDYQDEFDSDYMNLITTYLKFGKFEPEKSEMNKKGLALKPEEISFLLNSYARMLAQIGKEKQRDGKSYRLDIDNIYSFGTFVFDYVNDEIKVKFIPGKAFKQDLKNDAVAMEATAET